MRETAQERKEEREREDGERSHPPSGRDRAGPPPLGHGGWLHLQESKGKPRKCLRCRRHPEGLGAL